MPLLLTVHVTRLGQYLHCIVWYLIRCKPDLPDECAVNYGGCWHGDFNVNGRQQTFNACRDDIDKYKVRPYQALLLLHFIWVVTALTSTGCTHYWASFSFYLILGPW